MMSELLSQTQETALDPWTDAPMEHLIDSFDPVRIAGRSLAEDTSGVDPQRVLLWRLGVVMLSGSETDLIQVAQTRTVML